MREFIIKKGKHHCNRTFFIPHFKRNIISHLVRFDESCKYDLGEDQQDINKLFGLSFGLHHKNSARFGWRWNPDSGYIELLAYVYRKGKRINEWDENIMICKNVELNHTIILDLYVTNKAYLFSVENNKYTSSVEINHERLFPIGYHLFPYFGGNKTAPHTITIKSEKLY